MHDFGELSVSRYTVFLRQRIKGKKKQDAPPRYRKDTDILRWGYFPKELPPPFTTADFAIKHQSLSPSLKKEPSCLRFSYSRYAAVRRTLFIPNPAHMIRLADVVSENWASIDAHCSKLTLSRTLPKPPANGSATDRVNH